MVLALEMVGFGGGTCNLKILLEYEMCYNGTKYNDNERQVVSDWARGNQVDFYDMNLALKGDTGKNMAGLFPEGTGVAGSLSNRVLWSGV